jgi:hypothetical protein
VVERAEHEADVDEKRPDREPDHHLRAVFLKRLGTSSPLGTWHLGASSRLRSA